MLPSLNLSVCPSLTSDHVRSRLPAPFLDGTDISVCNNDVKHVGPYIHISWIQATDQLENLREGHSFIGHLNPDLW